ncbi:MAG: hypothetical protein ACK5O7_02730 [Holosporales bacterium]
MRFSTPIRFLSLAALLSVTTSYASEPQMPDLCDDVMGHIEGYLPAKSLGKMLMVNRGCERITNQVISNQVKGIALNMDWQKEDELLREFPADSIKSILQNLIREKGHVALSTHFGDSDFLSSHLILQGLLPENFRLARFEDWAAHVELLKPLYFAAFGQELPQAYQDLAVRQVMALAEIAFYVTDENAQEQLGHFLADHGETLTAFLSKQREMSPFVNFLHGDVDLAQLKSKPHTIVITDAELEAEAIQDRTHPLFQVHNGNYLRVTLGAGSADPKYLISEAARALPVGLGHLVLTDPEGKITRTKGFDIQNKACYDFRLNLPGLANVFNPLALCDQYLNRLQLNLPRLKSMKVGLSTTLTECGSRTLTKEFYGQTIRQNPWSM